MIGRSTLLSIVLALAAGVALFVVKYQVQALEDELASARLHLDESREAVHVLHAEWHYLTDPQRLADLAGRHLDLRPVTAENLVVIADVPMREPELPRERGGQIAEGPSRDSGLGMPAAGPQR
ncbi:MAG: hypothetical protein WD270_01085 [Acetobacterales bacterium]